MRGYYNGKLEMLKELEEYLEEYLDNQLEEQNNNTTQTLKLDYLTEDDITNKNYNNKYISKDKPLCKYVTLIGNTKIYGFYCRITGIKCTENKKRKCKFYKPMFPTKID